MHYLSPTREQLEGMLAVLPMSKPVVMLNLLAFRAQANYRAEDDHSPCSGKQAYGRYAAVAKEKMDQLGAKLIWNGVPQGMLIGPTELQWDNAFLVRYPSAEAFFTMISMPDYQAATVHRTAALADSRLIPNHEDF